jgi:hypothetical protein
MTLVVAARHPRARPGPAAFRPERKLPDGRRMASVDAPAFGASNSGPKGRHGSAAEGPRGVDFCRSVPRRRDVGAGLALPLAHDPKQPIPPVKIGHADEDQLRRFAMGRLQQTAVCGRFELERSARTSLTGLSDTQCASGSNQAAVPFGQAAVLSFGMLPRAAIRCGSRRFLCSDGRQSRSGERALHSARLGDRDFS